MQRTVIWRGTNRMVRMVLLSLGLSILCAENTAAQWAAIAGVTVSHAQTKLGGTKITIEYDLNEKAVSSEKPVYVFIRFSSDGGTTWALLPRTSLRGNGFDLVESPGHKEVVWWGTAECCFSDPARVLVRVRGIRMARVPAGTFRMLSLPAGGRDETGTVTTVDSLPTFCIAVCETTTAMYADYLNETGRTGTGWNKRMSSRERCGIVKDSSGYHVLAGRENHPVTYISWYDAVAFLRWCGVCLPTEAQWEKAFRGGMYLDGDATQKQPNPLPERSHPWGNEAPDAGGVIRCNFEGDRDGFEYTAPVATFLHDTSPYGVRDMAGNVAEWTQDWYSTSYHVGLDGFRMVRGGSWMAVPEACDAVTGATHLPLKESSITGFRCVR